jgi:hypothetical protein
MLSSQQPSAVVPLAQQADARRITALDFTKGALVCFMVVYHSLNYSAYNDLAFQYFSFLPPSFICITGFLLTNHYMPKYDSLGWKVLGRLISRGAKLVLIFILLNIGTKLTSAGHSISGEGSLGSYFSAWRQIFVEGNGRLVAFEVLLPIGYLLMLSPGLFWLQSISSWSVPGISVVLFLLCVLMEVKGISSTNLELLSAGVIGMSAGLASLERVNAVANRWLLLILLYAIYRFTSQFFAYSYVMQILGVCLSLLLIYAAGRYCGATGLWQREIILFGKYSLLAYIAQIAVLQVVTRFLIHRGTQWIGLAGLFLITLLITLLIVHVVGWMRRKQPLADQAYKLVFN